MNNETSLLQAKGTGNNGMLDVLAAAHWLKQEAAALGADPGTVSLSVQVSCLRVVDISRD